MKHIKYIILVFLTLELILPSCQNLNLDPMNIVQDKDIFTTEAGISAYMARMYSEMPIEDFRYGFNRGFFNFWALQPQSAVSGEALCRDVGGALSEKDYWGDAYKLIRDANYFMQTLPSYSTNFNEPEVNQWLGEARFIRAYTYFALVKRFGGVPLIMKVIDYPNTTTEELMTPRSSEEEVWDAVSHDLDTAMVQMQGTSPTGRANKYVAAGIKSRAMLYAGSIAEYNHIEMIDGKGKRLCGIPAARAVDYFQQSYNASKMLEGVYSLYLKQWAAGDKVAQYNNFVSMFFDPSSPENIFIKAYSVPSSVHGYDVYNVPRQAMGGGYSSTTCPTLDFVELFDGFNKDGNGHFQNLDATGHYILYQNTMDAFANAEPRLRATVILPGDIFKGESVEIRRGIYVGSVAGGISPLMGFGDSRPYETVLGNNLVSSGDANQTAYTLPSGDKMNPAGKSGIFASDGTCAYSGFSVRKYLVPDKPQSQVIENNSDQSWIELRYGEILLNRAEAAFELHSLGIGGVNYVSDAYDCIQQIRSRAGADPMASSSDLTIAVIRKERRKELGFENKVWWDMRRWRTADQEQNATKYRVLEPFYSSVAKKYFFDVRKDEKNREYTFNSRTYYQQIPTGEVAKNPLLLQNPGF